MRSMSHPNGAEGKGGFPKETQATVRKKDSVICILMPQLMLVLPPRLRCPQL